MTEPAIVLIVDHDDTSNDLAASTLTAAGYRVAVAASEADLLAALEQPPPDIVILAQNESARCGDSAGRTLVESHLPRNVPLVLLTDTGEAAPAGRLHPSARLNKPVAPQTLVDVVRRCLRRGPARLNLGLTSEAIRIQEEERRKLSAELHDDVAQVLGNLVLMMDTCLGLAPAEAEQLRKHLTSARDTAKEGFRRVQGFSIDLRPPMLDDLGLAPTIAWYVERFANEAGLAVELDMPQSLPSLNGEQETAIFRIIQEALRNVRRHADAKHVSVAVQRPAGLLSVTISDDGVGFDPEEMTQKVADGTHLGLAGIRYRVALLLGTFVIDSKSGYGTTVTVEIPVSGC